MLERLAQEPARRVELLPLDERHHHLLVRRPEQRLRRRRQLAERRVGGRHRTAALEPGERVAQRAHPVFRVGRDVLARRRDQVLGDAERERGKLALIRHPIGLGRGRDPGFERGARARLVTEPLLRQRHHRPERGRLLAVGGPLRRRRVVGEGGGGDGDDIGVAVFLIERKAAIHDRDDPGDDGLERRRLDGLRRTRTRRERQRRHGTKRLRGPGRPAHVRVARARRVPRALRAPAPLHCGLDPARCGRHRRRRRRRPTDGMLGLRGPHQLERAEHDEPERAERDDEDERFFGQHPGVTGHPSAIER